MNYKTVNLCITRDTPLVHVREADAARDNAVRKGLRMIRSTLPVPEVVFDDDDQAIGEPVDQSIEDSWELADPSKATRQDRLATHIDRALRSFDLCGRRAWTHPCVVRDRGGDEYRGRMFSGLACHARGHENCVAEHAVRDLADWHGALDLSYGGEPVRLVTLAGPGLGIDAAIKVARSLVEAAAVRAAVGDAIGYVSALGGKRPGYGVLLVVPGRSGSRELSALLREWRKRVPFGWLRTDDDLADDCDPFEALVEARARSEQAVALLVVEGEITAETGAAWLSIEIGADTGSAMGGQRRRLVCTKALRKFRRQHKQAMKALADAEAEDRRQMLELAAGAEGLPAGAGSRAATESQATTPHSEPYRADPYDSNGGADAANLRAMGTSGAAGGGPGLRSSTGAGMTLYTYTESGEPLELVEIDPRREPWWKSARARHDAGSRARAIYDRPPGPGRKRVGWIAL